MGYWGIRSYENDDANDALDAGFEHVHADRYEELMDDRNPLTFEQVQKQLANAQTLQAAIEVLEEMMETPLDGEANSWDEAARVAFAGVVVRHAELGVPIPEDHLALALAWLEAEDLEWDEPTKRQLRRDQEIALLGRAKTVPPALGQANTPLPPKD